jgi:hypothetical protein
MSYCYGHTDCTGESTGNGILAIEDTDPGGQIKSRIKCGKVEKDRWIKPGLKQADQKPNRNQLACQGQK